MTDPKRSAAVFLSGAAVYPALELIWRGRTHISMAALGGCCMVMLDGIDRATARRSAPVKALAGCAAITAAEFLSGCLLNRVLKLKVWDYSRRKGNLLGQICPLYCALWFLLCFPAFGICRACGRLTRKGGRNIIRVYSERGF